MTTKFSQFPEGGNVRVGDKTVGLRDGENTQFNMPGTGIQDADGNFLVAWSAADNAVNYMQYTNADTGDYPILEAKGQDATVGLNINTKGNGSVRLNMGTGDLVINDTVGINEISNDDTFADASDETLQTSLATKTYIDTQVGSSVTLTSAGVAVGTTSLVNDGTGPALAIKGVVGGTNIAVTTNATDTTVAITGTIPIARGGTNNTTIGASGTIAQSDGSKWASTTATYPGTAGTSGTLLTSNGTNIVNTTATYPSTAGTSGTMLRSNGTNIVNSTPTYPNTATSGKVMRGDGTNWVESTPTYPNTANTGKILRGDGTNWVETTAQYPNTAGTSGNILTSDGTNWISSAIPVSCAHAALTNNPLPTKALNTTPAEISGASVAWTLDYGVDFSMANDGQLKYTGASPKTFLICASLAVGNVTQGLVALRKNGSTVIKSIVWASSQMFPPIMNYKVDLVQNDYLSIYFNFTTGSGGTLNVCGTMSAFNFGP